MKKSLAVMLALIMVLCMIPTTALAKLDTGHKIDVTFTVLYVGDEFNIGYNYGASEKTQFVCQYSTNHSDTAYNNHTIAISDIKAAADRATVNSGYQIVGWSKESNANPTVWSLNKSGTTACNKGTTIYLVAKNPNPQPTKPTANDIPGIVGNNAVKVHCTTNNSHAEKTYGLISGSFTIGDVTKDTTSGNYTCTITVQPGEYVSAYNGTYSKHKLETEGQICTIKLEWNGSKWEVVSDVPVVFNVKCENQTPEEPNPPKPLNTSEPVFVELIGDKAVKVHCTNDKASHIEKEKTYGLMLDGYKVGKVKGNAESGYTCDITVEPDKYVGRYNYDIQVGHTLAPEGQTGTIKLKWDKTEEKWEVVSDVPVVFTVTCKTPEQPTTGAIIINKTVTGLPNDKLPASFNFEIKQGEKTRMVTANREGTDNTYKSETVQLPYGTYTINEVGADVDGFKLNPTGLGEVTIDKEHKEVKVNVTNAYEQLPPNTGTIIVKKTVSGGGADYNKAFTFTVTLKMPEITVDASDAPIINTTPGTSAAPTPVTETYGGVTFTNGVATFELKHNQEKTITEIPAGMAYTVTESGNAGYTVTMSGNTGTIKAGETSTAAFNNYKAGDGGHGHYHPDPTPVPVIVIPPKTGDMTIWQSILHFLGIR